MKVKITIEHANMRAKVTVGNDKYVAWLTIPDMSTMPNPNLVDPGDGTATEDDVSEGKVFYTSTGRGVGKFKQDNPNIIDTSAGDITSGDVRKGKKAFSQGQEIDGDLDVDTLVDEAYRDGRDDVIDSQSVANITPPFVLKKYTGFGADNTRVDGLYDVTQWQNDPEAWQIYDILANDNTPGYVAKMAVLAKDSWKRSYMAGADAYRTSDGAFYTPANKLDILGHEWQTNAFKTGADGIKTKYIIRYYKTNILSSSAVNQPKQGQASASVPYGMGCWPTYIVCRDASIFMQNFLIDGFDMECYDHINCVYTGTSMAGFLGGSNNISLQRVPLAYSYPSPFPASGAPFLGRKLKKVSVAGWDWSRYTNNFNGFMSGNNAMEEIEGVIDMYRATADPTNFLTNCYTLRRFTIRNCNVNLTFQASSLLEYDTLMDLLYNGMADRTGDTPLTVKVGPSINALDQAEIDQVFTTRNIIVTQ